MTDLPNGDHDDLLTEEQRQMLRELEDVTRTRLNRRVSIPKVKKICMLRETINKRKERSK